MKLHSWHEARGDAVSFHEPDPDRVYISIIFKKNRHLAKSVALMYPNAEVVPGGPGHDPSTILPPDVERCRPSGEIYPEDGYSYGRVTSGCVRKCHFCMVPIQEPLGIRYIQHPSMFHRPGTTLRIFDDNILALPKAWKDFHDYAFDYNVKVHIEYLDIRFITDTTAKELMELHHDRGEVWFAFDFAKTERYVRRGVERLNDAGFAGYRLRFNVYCHDENAVPEARERWRILRELKVDPFLMVNDDNITPRLARLRRRCTRPAIWRGADVDLLFDLETTNDTELKVA
jgi:hypothetical protein